MCSYGDFCSCFARTKEILSFVRWIGKFEIATKRLTNAWVDLHEPPELPDATTTAFADLLAPALRTELTNIVDSEDRLARANECRDQMIEAAKTRHRDAFSMIVCCH